MAKLLGIASKYKGLSAIKTPLFGRLFDWFSSLDRFTKTSVIVLALIAIATPLIITTRMLLQQYASSTITTSLIDDFESDTTSVNGWTFVGNSGSLTLGSGYNSNHAASLSFNFSNNPSTVTTWQNVRAQHGFTTAQPIAKELGFWVKSPAGVGVSVMVVDSANNTLVYNLNRPFEATDPNAWYQQVVKLDNPYYSTSTSPIVYPITSIAIEARSLIGLYNLSNVALLSGQIAFDNVQWMDMADSSTVTLPISRTIDPATVVAVPNSTSNLLNQLSTGTPGNLTTTNLSWMAKTQMKWARRDMTWQNIETSPGVYNFSYYDSYYNSLQSIGMGALFILDYGNTLYMTSTSTPPTTSTQITAYTNFAKAAAAHFAGKNVRFEVWNEPDNTSFWPPAANAQQYATLESTVSPQVLSANTSAQVTTGGFAEDYQYFQAFLANGGGKAASAIAMHPYRQAPPETVSDDALYIKTFAALQLGHAVPIWNTEWGYPTDATWWNLGSTVDYYSLQAKMDARALWTALAIGLQHSNLYMMQDVSTAGDYMGLYDSSGNAKPSAVAVDTATANMAGYTLSGIIPTQLSDLHALLLTNGTNNRLVLWLGGATALSFGGNVAVTFPAQYTPTATDYLGSTSNVSMTNNQNGTYSVFVSDSPVYITIPLTNATPTPAPTATPTPAPTATPTPISSDTTPPSVSITSPLSGSTVSRKSNVTITATASDNIAVSSVAFLVNGSVVCTDTVSPYSCAWTVPGKPNATYTLTAKATDTSGNTTLSAPVTISGH